MGNYIYTKTKPKDLRKFFRFFGLSIAIVGLLFGLYTFYPIISWQLYINPAFANNNFTSPIPQTNILTKDIIQNLLKNSFQQGSWLPVYKDSQATSNPLSYKISIPKLDIVDAEVSASDTYIDKHLIHYPGTALPPNKGNAVIFGHSTLPQLYDPTNYKTIFAKAHNLKVDDTIVININDLTLVYKIFNISIVNADETSYLTQQQDDSYLTLVTCTPPGTIWKRLIIKASVNKI